MIAVARPFTVAELAKRQAAAVPQQALPGLPAWVYTLAAPFAGFVAGYVINVTSKIASLNVWFLGASAAIVNAPANSVIDLDGALAFAMEELERMLLRSRAQTLEVVRSLEEMDGRRTRLMRDAFRLYAQVNSDLFESVQAYRWAVLEHDADADIAAGRTSERFASAANLIASLNS